MVLKPQDVFVVLKIVAAGSLRAPYAQLASELQMSSSEVHAWGIKISGSNSRACRFQLETRLGWMLLKPFVAS